MTQAHAIGEFAYAERNIKESHGSAKKLCVDSDSNDDEPEKEEKALTFPTSRSAIQLVDELTQFAWDSVEEEELVTSLNSVCRLHKERRTKRFNQKNIRDYFLEQMLLYKQYIC